MNALTTLAIVGTTLVVLCGCSASDGPALAPSNEPPARQPAAPTGAPAGSAGCVAGEQWGATESAEAGTDCTDTAR